MYRLQKFLASRVLWLVLAGGIITILAKMRHSAADNWSYPEAIPVLPVLEVFSVLQFPILPTLIFWLAAEQLNICKLEFNQQKII